MGENTAGIAEFHLRPSSRGAQYVFRFAETVNPDGSLDFRSTGAFATQCIQQDVYIARGDAEGEVYRSRFTYHAYRYVEITGYFDLRQYGKDPDTDIAVGLVMSTDLEQAGSFRCANEDINRLQGIMMSTFRSNYHGFPEDCPGREKCGWLGDAQVVCNTGMMNYRMQASYEKYLHDIRTEVEMYGVWQMIAPGMRGCGEATPLWGCAQVLIPYWMYRYYGDRAVVDDNWDMMCRWVEHEAADAKDFIITRGLGDWCPPVGLKSDRRIPVPESSTQMFYEICCRMSELAAELGLDGKEHFDRLAANIKDACIRTFWLPREHRYSTWGSCGVALETGLYPAGEREALVRALVELVKADDCAMSTGIYGNKYLIPALCDEGYGDLALRILFNRDHVSFGTMMDGGATSLFECLETECVGRPRERGTASFNHPMHAGFAYFLYRCVAGIRPLTPGFGEFEIRPDHFDGIPSADVTYETPYGTVAVSFVRRGRETVYSFRVPVNTTCRFRAGGRSEVYGSGSYTVTVTERGGSMEPVKFKRLDPAAILPTYATPGSAGADLYALPSGEPVVIAPGATACIRTGLAAAIPCGYVGLVFARSGLACRQGLAPANKVGVIDSDYRGEWLIYLYNQASEPRVINPGDRVAQLVLLPVLTPTVVEADSLDETDRGAGGFGSTGQ